MLAHLEARCQLLATELDHRGRALYEHARKEEALLARIAQLEKLLGKQEEKMAHLKNVVDSAVRWQTRGWWQRALHKWRVPKRA